MRPLLAVLSAACLLTANIASASQCARPVEKAAFDVTGLKSHLMVTALVCQSDATLGSMDKYNAFIVRFRSSLLDEERSLNSYFHRAFGRAAQKEHDDYITLLANAQSDAGIKQGTLFCQQNIGMFNEVMALKDGKDLPTYAQAKALAQPIALVDCPAAPVRATRTAKK